MNPNSTKWISRKEIALELEMTPESIRVNESRIGLDKIKVQVNARVVVYPRESAVSRIKKLFPGTFATC